MKAAIIENGTVTNVVKVQDEAFATSQGWVVSNTAKIGDTYQNGEFTTPEPPPPPVPASVTKRQAKEALIRNGLYQQALDALEAITDPTEKAIAKNYWSESQAFERDNATLNALAIGGLGMTQSELDDLFRYAETL